MSNNTNTPNKDFMTFLKTKEKNGDIVLKGDCWQGKHFKNVITITYDFSKDMTKVVLSNHRTKYLSGVDLLTKYECCKRAVKEAVKIKLLKR